MRADEALAVIDALESAGVPLWVSGGWGVDALAGRQSREHRDLDLAVDAGHLDVAVRVLGGMGFAPETDWLPVRLEVGGGPGGWVDLHPVAFDVGGDGVQQGFRADEQFPYPAADLTTGIIGGREVPCVSARLQRVFHTGYDPREQDRHDVAVLDALDAAGSA